MDWDLPCHASPSKSKIFDSLDELSSRAFGDAEGTLDTRTCTSLAQPMASSAAMATSDPTTRVAYRAPKRKKTTSGVPETSKRFAGLVFYFIPLKSKNPVRKIRYKKAVEHGAQCLEEWLPEKITHIITDARYSQHDILRELKIPMIPNGLVVVKEDWLADCLEHGRLVEPKQKVYRAHGTYGTMGDQAPCTPPNGSFLGDGGVLLPCAMTEPAIHEGGVNPLGSMSAITMERVEGSSRGQKGHRSGDELDNMIADALRLDFDPFSDDEQPPLDADGYADDSGNESSPKKKPARDTSSKEKRRGTAAIFQCMQKYDGSATDNPNSRTIEVLSQMQEYYERIKDTWRSLGYRKAIAALKQQDRKISFASEAIELPFVGPRLAAKIEEIVQTDTLSRLRYANLEPEDLLLKKFLGIYGAGFVHARRWIAAGYKSLEDLVTAQLTPSQRIGVEHYDDFNSRIPREEVQVHGNIVKKVAAELDKDLALDIMGSFRRGAETCGDIDIMITKQGTAGELRPILDRLVERLFSVGFLQCGLATPRGHEDGSKWHGASKVDDKPWRRIDFLLVPHDERGAALLYFTGNDIFNRSMRLLASKKGFRLNQRGLYSGVIRGPSRKKITEGTLVEGESERVATAPPYICEETYNGADVTLYRRSLKYLVSPIGLRNIESVDSSLLGVLALAGEKFRLNYLDTMSSCNSARFCEFSCLS